MVTAVASGAPGNLQKQLMLLGLQPCADRRTLAEVQKQTQFITKIGEYAKQGMIVRKYYREYSYLYRITI